MRTAAKPFARTLGRLARDTRGASVIETALLMPTFLLLLAGTTDLAMAFSLKLRTQQASARSAEMMTAASLETLTFDQMRADAAAAAGVPVNQVTVSRWLECGGAQAPLFDAVCPEGQQTARYVAVRVSNSYSPVLGPFLPSNVAPAGRLPFVGYSSVRIQ